METGNAIVPRVAEKTTGRVVTYREIQEIVRKMNNAEGKSAMNYHPRARLGKSRIEADRREGLRREQNKDERAEWSKNGGHFPAHTCNGRRYYRGTLVRTMPNKGKHRS